MSTYHALKFDPRKGEILWKGTRQGYSDQSCWARRQAWALGGFVSAAGAAETAEFDPVIDALWGYAARNLPEDRVPSWDFEAPRIPNTWRDSSAGAIIANALLRRAEQLGPEAGKVEHAAAMEMLRSLVESFQTRPGEPAAGILKHGCFHAPQKVAADECLIWGDYYFVAALLRAATLVSRHVSKISLGGAVGRPSVGGLGGLVRTTSPKVSVYLTP